MCQCTVRDYLPSAAAALLGWESSAEQTARWCDRQRRADQAARWANAAYEIGRGCDPIIDHDCHLSPRRSRPPTVSRWLQRGRLAGGIRHRIRRTARKALAALGIPWGPNTTAELAQLEEPSPCPRPAQNSRHRQPSGRDVQVSNEAIGVLDQSGHVAGGRRLAKICGILRLRGLGTKRGTPAQRHLGGQSDAEPTGGESLRRRVVPLLPISDAGRVGSESGYYQRRRRSLMRVSANVMPPSLAPAG